MWKVKLNILFPVWVAVALIGVLQHDVSWWVPGLIALYGTQIMVEK